MNANPLFSVLIANYNNGKYLMEAINSVYAQTYTNWEIILVDDASTDNSKEIYKELEKDTRIHIFYNDENHGCGYTKRRCAELANGELCGFLDPDDMLLPEAIDKHINVHIKHDDVAIVYSLCYYCDADYNIIRKRNIDLKDNETFFNHRGSAHLASYKKSYYEKTEGISEKLKAGVDQDLYFKIEEVGNFYLLKDFTYKYVARRDTAITSERNIINLSYWNYEVVRATCIRRNLDFEDIMIKEFRYAIKNCVPTILKQERDTIYNSNSYRIGYLILTPFRWIKKLVKK